MTDYAPYPDLALPTSDSPDPSDHQFPEDRQGPASDDRAAREAAAIGGDPHGPPFGQGDARRHGVATAAKRRARGGTLEPPSPQKPADKHFLCGLCGLCVARS